MKTVITIEGLRKLKEMALNSEKLPETWKMDVEKYLKMKERAANMKKEIYLECVEKLREGVEIKEILYGHENR